MSAIVGESSDFGPSPRLIVMNADGTNPRVFNWVLDASLAPNGRSIAFTQRTQIPIIRVIATDRHSSSRLLVRNAWGVDWSPSGKAIAFIRGDDLWMKDLRKREQTRIVRNARAPDWSRDETKLAFVRDNDVWVIEVASKRTRRLIRDADAPRWSPDGTHIAFERLEWDRSHTRIVDSHIYVARANGRNQQRVPIYADSPAWSPDGHELAASEFRRIIRIRLDGTHRHVVYSRECCSYRDIDWVAG